MSCILLIFPLASGCVHRLPAMQSDAALPGIPPSNPPFSQPVIIPQPEYVGPTSPQQELTPESAAELAVLRNPHLKAVYQEVGIAQADLIQAGLFNNPDFNGEVRITEGGEDAHLEMGLKIDFLDIVLKPLQRSAASSELERTRAHVAGEMVAVVGDTKRAFYRLQGSEQELEQRLRATEALRVSSEMAEMLRQAGNITELDLLNHRALHEQSILDLQEAQLRVLQNRLDLNRVLGISDASAEAKIRHQLPAPVDLGAPADLVKAALTKSLDLKIAWFEITTLAARLGISRMQSPIPELLVGVAAERDPGNEWSVGPAMAVELPIFDKGEARIAKKSAELQRAWAEYRAVAVEIASSVQSAKRRLDVSRARLVQYEKVLLPLQQNILEQTQLRYNGMYIGVFELLEAKRKQIETERKYISELLTYWLAQADIEQLLSGKITKGA